MASTIPAPRLTTREEWPDADFELNDDEPLHSIVQESDKEEDDDWDVEMNLGKTGGAKAQAVVAGIAARSASARLSLGVGGASGMVNIRPPIVFNEEDEDEDEGFSTIKVATIRPTPLDPKVVSGPSSGVPTPTPGASAAAATPAADDDFESDFSLPSNLTQLSLRPLSHQSSKNSLEWGDKDQTSSSQSSDAYSTLGLDHGSVSSSTQPETDDDDEEDLEGLVLPSGIFDSGSGSKHLTKLLELKKNAPTPEHAVKIASPDPEDDFEIGLVLSDDADFSQSRLLQNQQQYPRRSPLAARSNSLPSRPLITRPPSRLRADRAKSPTNPPLASQRQLQKIGRVSPSPPPRAGPSRSKSALLAPSPSATAAKPGSLRGQKSHTGLNNNSTSPPGSQRKLTRKASLSSLMDNTHQPVASGSGKPSAQSARYDAPTAASKAKSHSTSTGRMRGMVDYGVPPTRPSTPSSNPSAVRLTLPTNISRLKSRPPISSVFPSPTIRATSPLNAIPRPQSSLSIRSKSGGTPQPTAGPSSSTAPTGPRLLRKPKRIRLYGDGTELDAFDDLPTDSQKESEYRVQPKGYGNRIPGAMYSPKKSTMAELGKGTIRRKPTRDLSNSGSGPESAPRQLKRTGRVDSTSSKASSPESMPKRKKVSSPGRSRRKPTLIRNLGGANAPKVVGEMKWNPQTLRWEGNDQALRDFDAAMAPSRPALITHLTGSSVGSPVSSFGTGVRRVGNMIFDPERMCWISTLAPEDDEPDVFADLADDEGDWDAQAQTIRALQTPSIAPSDTSGGEPPSPARSGRVRSPSESGSDRGSRAPMVCDVDDSFLDQCRAAEERHRNEMKGWRSKLDSAFAGADRSYLYEIRALATRQY